MNIAVCVKQIPDPDGPSALDESTHRLVRAGKIILDDSDAYGVEMALRLVESAGSGEVVVVSMTPDADLSGIRSALAMGADRAIVISDPLLSGSDALGTAKVLAAAIRRLDVDLVIAATESTDGYSGTVPVQIAELLDLPAVSFARHVEIADGLVCVERQTEQGSDDVVCPLPALVTVTAGVVEPRYPTFKGIMSAKSKPLEAYSIADLGLDKNTVGAPGARQDILAVEVVPPRPPGEIVTDEGNGSERILAFLDEIKVI